MSTPRHWHSRFAAGFVVIGLALSAFGVLYLFWTEVSVQSLPPPGKEARQRAVQLSFELLFVIFMMFLIGSYAMVKVGRYMLDRTPAERSTDYVDAWGNYRVTDEQIKAATDQWEDAGDKPPPADPDAGPPPAGR
jgi:hypothetical protein